MTIGFSSKPQSFYFSMSEAVSAEFCLERTQIESVIRPDVFLPITSPDLFSTLGDVLWMCKLLSFLLWKYWEGLANWF